MEQKNHKKIEKMREKIDSKLEAILKEVKSNKTASTMTNPRSDFNEMQAHNLRVPKLSSL